MIRSREEMREYYRADIKMSGLAEKGLLHHFVDRRYKFYKNLRRTEYYVNTFKGPLKLLAKLQYIKYRRLCYRYQWGIPINVFEKGLSIVHVGTIVVSSKAKIGKNCRIHVCVNIGNAVSHGVSGTPTIGDNVYIGPGAKVFGDIVIGDKTVIGANAVVNKSFPEGHCTIAGVPAKVITQNDSSMYIEED